MNVLTTAAAICGALTVVLIFAAAVARLRWVRWVWRRLVSEPLAGWQRGIVEPIAAAAVAPVQLAVDALANDLREHMAEESETIAATAASVVETNGRLSAIEARVEGLIDWLIPERAELRDGK